MTITTTTTITEYAKQAIHNTIFLTAQQPIVHPVPEQQLQNLQNSWVSEFTELAKLTDKFLPPSQP